MTTNPTTPSTPNIPAIAAAIAARLGLNPAEEAAIAAAFATRGRHAGTLLAKCPADTGPRAQPLAAAAWRGMQPNPWKVSPWSLLMQGPEASALYEKLARHTWPVRLDRDAAALAAMGVW